MKVKPPQVCVCCLYNQFLIAQELPLPQIDRHMPEENWDSTCLERNGPLLALAIPVGIMTGFFILNKFYNNH